MIRVQVAFNTRLYRVSFDPEDDTAETIERYSRHVLTSYTRDGHQRMAMQPTDNPVYLKVWHRGRSRPAGPLYHHVIVLARAARARGRTFDVLPRAEVLRDPRTGAPAPLPVAVERELREMAEQGLSFS